MELAGRVAIVTGGANGMGAALVRRLAADGLRVATCDVDDAGLARLGADLPAVHVAHTDLADAGARRRFVAEVESALGPVDVLVNDAGVGVGGPLAEITGGDWAWIRSVNLDAPVHLMHLVVPGMTARGFGRVLNVASMAGITIQPYIATYVATKHALYGLSRAAHEELRHRGVTVTVACPGMVRTGIIERSRLRGLHADDVAALMRLTAIEPAVAAARMLAAMRRGRPVVIPNRDVRLVYLLYRLWPRGFDALVGRLAFHAYERQQRVPAGVPT